jgi:hypothetical protein
MEIYRILYLCVYRFLPYGLALPQDAPAFHHARGDLVRETSDKRMRESFFRHAAPDVGNMVGQLACEIIHRLNRFVGIEVQLLRQSAPVTEVDIADAVFAADLHGEFDAVDIDVGIGKNARDIVEGAQDARGLQRR